MRTFIITGTSRGLGEALTAHIITHKLGHVVAIARRATAQQDAWIAQHSMQLVQGDLANAPALATAALAAVPKETSSVVFIDNAATLHPIAKTGALPLAAYEDALRINVLAPVTIANTLLAASAPWALALWHISTGAANRPLLGWASYCSSKAAIAHFYRVVESEHPDVTVRIINPGVMDTHMQAQIRETTEEDFPQKAQFVDYYEQGELASATDVAQRILTEGGVA